MTTIDWGATADVVDHMYFRILPDGLRVWTIGLEWQSPIIVQIRCDGEHGISRRVAMALALLLYANRAAIERTVLEFGGNHEVGFMLEVVLQRDYEEFAKEKLPQREHGEPLSADFMSSSVPWGEEQPPTAIILHDDYESMGDWSAHPENKALVWLLMNVHSLLVAHCLHQDRTALDGLSRKSREFCQAIPL